MLVVYLPHRSPIRHDGTSGSSRTIRHPDLFPGPSGARELFRSLLSDGSRHNTAATLGLKGR
eukprot:scaffold263648_cov18-Prasinocladus_malaysianus.AAC.1